MISCILSAENDHAPAGMHVSRHDTDTFFSHLRSRQTSRMECGIYIMNAWYNVLVFQCTLFFVMHSSTWQKHYKSRKVKAFYNWNRGSQKIGNIQGNAPKGQKKCVAAPLDDRAMAWYMNLKCVASYHQITVNSTVKSYTYSFPQKNRMMDRN